MCAFDGALALVKSVYKETKRATFLDVQCLFEQISIGAIRAVDLNPAVHTPIEAIDCQGLTLEDGRSNCHFRMATRRWVYAALFHMQVAARADAISCKPAGSVAEQLQEPACVHAKNMFTNS